MNRMQFIKSIEQQMIQWRRQFHKNPELGFMEYRTTAYIYRHLKKLQFKTFIGQEVMSDSARYGLPAKATLRHYEKTVLKQGEIESAIFCEIKDGFTGVIGQIKSKHSGPHSAFRFDIDALPITETTEKSHHPYKNNYTSTNKGVMHACGHDGHIAIGLALATYISKRINQLTGTFTLIFQPAEEGGRGAHAIVENGWLDGVDYFYSGHIGLNDLDVGTVALAANGFLASTKIDVLFKGEASHAGISPEKGKNSLLAAANAVMNLYAISRHSEGISRINVGKMIGGTGRNVIAPSSKLEIETRGETERINRYLTERALAILEGSAKMYDVSLKKEVAGQTNVVNCHPELIEKLFNHIQTDDYIKNVLKITDVSGSEDVSFMMNRVHNHGGKATYMIFGANIKHGHHHPSFDFNERVLTIALDVYIQALGIFNKRR